MKSEYVRCTFSLSEEMEDLLTDLYIKQLKSKNRKTRSTIVAEALQLLWEKEHGDKKRN